MDLIALIGIVLLIAGAYFLIVPHAILIGAICLIAGLFLLAGGPGYVNRRY